MILLGVPPCPTGQDLSVNLLSLPPLLLRPGQDIAGDCRLLIIVRKDSGAVLGADVSALAVQGGRIVHFEEEFD